MLAVFKNSLQSLCQVEHSSPRTCLNEMLSAFLLWLIQYPRMLSLYSTLRILKGGGICACQEGDSRALILRNQWKHQSFDLLGLLERGGLRKKIPSVHLDMTSHCEAGL